MRVPEYYIKYKALFENKVNENKVLSYYVETDWNISRIFHSPTLASWNEYQAKWNFEKSLAITYQTSHLVTSIIIENTIYTNYEYFLKKYSVNKVLNFIISCTMHSLYLRGIWAQITKSSDLYRLDIEKWWEFKSLWRVCSYPTDIKLKFAIKSNKLWKHSWV